MLLNELPSILDEINDILNKSYDGKINYINTLNLTLATIHMLIQQLVFGPIRLNKEKANPIIPYNISMATLIISELLKRPPSLDYASYNLSTCYVNKYYPTDPFKCSVYNRMHGGTQE